MDDRDRLDHESLISRSRQVQEDARETVANARATIARSTAIIERLRVTRPELFPVLAE
jgi:hypothetical protein